MAVRILITGVNGMLGSAICRHFNKNNNLEVFGLGRSPENASLELKKYFQGDFTNPSFLETIRKDDSFDFIIHCAAIVNLKTCEENHELAKAVHVTASKNLAEQFSEATFIYISTDSVFNGYDGNYSEVDKTEPLNNYCRSKHEGELAIANINQRHYILRLNIYGFNIPGGGSLFEWAYNSLKNNESISGFDNFIFNPLYTGQVAQIIENIILNQPTYGTYHIGSASSLSKFDFLQVVAESFGFDQKLIRKEIASQKDALIKRPENTTLNTDKIYNSLSMNKLDIKAGMEMLKNDMHNLNII